MLVALAGVLAKGYLPRDVKRHGKAGREGIVSFRFDSPKHRAWRVRNGMPV